MVTAVFRPACSRSGSPGTYQLSYVPLDSANQDQRSARTIPTRRTQIRLSKMFTCVVVARKDGMARTAYSNSDSEDDPKEVTAIGKIPASTRGDGVPSFASFAGFRGSRCPGF